MDTSASIKHNIRMGGASALLTLAIQLCGKDTDAVAVVCDRK